MPIYLAARILLSDYCQGFLNEQKETKPFIYGNNGSQVMSLKFHNNTQQGKLCG